MSSGHPIRRIIAGAFGFFLAMAIFPSVGAQLTLTNSNSISMTESETNAITVAAPYPSSITVSGLTGQVITNLTVTLNGFSHTFPSDASILLTGPGGQAAILMSDAGGQNDFPVTNLTITFDDHSPNILPILDSLYSDTFQPGAFSLPLQFSFPSPAPAGNSNAPTALSVFRNTDPDGVWSLYALDSFEGSESGSIAGGWTLNISTGVPLKGQASGTNLVLSWPIVAGESFVLQTTLSPTNVNSWSNLTGSVTQTNGRNILVNTNVIKTNPVRFYRLLGQ